MDNLHKKAGIKMKIDDVIYSYSERYLQINVKSFLVFVSLMNPRSESRNIVPSI